EYTCVCDEGWTGATCDEPEVGCPCTASPIWEQIAAPGVSSCAQDTNPYAPSVDIDFNAVDEGSPGYARISYNVAFSYCSANANGIGEVFFGYLSQEEVDACFVEALALCEPYLP
ncbi:hypothetical protein, partial [Enhygromyxa salina]|uniref:hypothetical protein n=1 Tax=Enhygromyxa salina TaxID=215803 RepID=UPI00196A1905